VLLFQYLKGAGIDPLINIPLQPAHHLWGDLVGFWEKTVFNSPCDGRAAFTKFVLNILVT
jgi:hypothetical protein